MTQTGSVDANAFITGGSEDDCDGIVSRHFGNWLILLVNSLWRSGS